LSSKGSIQVRDQLILFWITTTCSSVLFDRPFDSCFWYASIHNRSYNDTRLSASWLFQLQASSMFLSRATSQMVWMRKPSSRAAGATPTTISFSCPVTSHSARMRLTCPPVSPATSASTSLSSRLPWTPSPKQTWQLLWLYRVALASSTTTALRTSRHVWSTV